MKYEIDKLTEQELLDLCALEWALSEKRLKDPCMQYAGHLVLMAEGFALPEVAQHIKECNPCRLIYLRLKAGAYGGAAREEHEEEGDGSVQGPSGAQVIPFPDRSGEGSAAADEDGDPDWEEMSILEMYGHDGRTGRGGGTPRKFKHGGCYWVFSAKQYGNDYIAKLQRPGDFPYVHTASLLTSDGEEIVVFAADETKKKFVDSKAYAKFFQAGVRLRVDRS